MSESPKPQSPAPGVSDSADSDRAVTPAQADYIARVNRAIDWILANLHRPHKLDEIAKAAQFSPFHFHRVFQGMVGETPAQFTKRLRLERALTIMVHNPSRALTDVALDTGFSSLSDFSRSFKQRYGEPPSAFDAATWRRERRQELQQLVEQADESLHVAQLPAGANPDGFAVELLELPRRSVAYWRVLDPFREDVVVNAAKRLVQWAEDAGVADHPWYGYMWDDPEVVELKRCRYDVAVEAPRAATGGEIGHFEFPPMRVAKLHIDGGIDLEMRALDWLYHTWLPSSGWVPADLPCFEAWVGRPFAHGLERFVLDLHLPIQ